MRVEDFDEINFNEFLDIKMVSLKKQECNLFFRNPLVYF